MSTILSENAIIDHCPLNKNYGLKCN